VRHGPRRISSGGFSLQAPGAKTAPWLLSSRRGGEIRLALPPDLSRRSGRGLACPGNRINDLGNGCRIGLLRRRHHNRSQAAAAPLQEAMPGPTMNRSPACRDQSPGNSGEPMAGVLQWIGLAFGMGLIAFGVMGFFRGLSLPPNTPRHRSHGKGENCRT
jgi:hypothetical protein